MPDENIRIVVTAVNLASAKLREIAAHMDMLDDASGRNLRAFRQLQQGTERLGIAQRSVTTDTERLGITTRTAGQELERFDRTVGGARVAVRDLGSETDRGTGIIRRHGQEVGRAGNEYQQWGRFMRLHRMEMVGFGQDTDRVTRTLVIHEQRVRDTGRAYDAWGHVVQDTEGKMLSMAAAIDKTDEAKRRHERNIREQPAAHQSWQRALLGTMGVLGRFTATLGAAGLGLYTAGNAVGSLTAGAIGLTSALSSLVGVAVAVPAAFTAMAGSMAAITTIFKPAISQVQDFLTAMNKANDPTAQTAAGPSGVAQARQQGAQGIADAQRALDRARQQSAMQLVDLERRLFELRITNAQQAADAERALDRARLTGLQQIIDAEERLHALRMADRAQEQQLEAALANAQASARGEAARGGAEQAIANAAVQQAQDTLTQFQQQAGVQEAQAGQNVTQARQQRQQNVGDAQRTLTRTLQDNAQQIQDMERQIAEQRIQNVQQVSDAERALARARVQAEQQVASATASSNTQLSNARAILAAMSPLQRQLALDIEKMVSRWKELTAPAQTSFLRVAIQLVDRINSHLPELARLVSHYANIITQTGGRLIRDVFQPQRFQRETRFANQQATNLGTVGQGAIGGLNAIITVATSQGGEQFLRWLATAVRNFGLLLQHMAEIQNRKDGFVGFFEATRKTLQQVADILWNLVQAFANIFEVGFKPGSSFLGGIVNLTKRFKDWTDSQQGQDSLRHFLHTGFADLHQWAQILGPFVKLIGETVVLTTEWTVPMKLLTTLIQWLITNPLTSAVIGPVLAFGAAWAALGFLLPGNQRTLSTMFKLIRDTTAFIFGRAIPAIVIFAAENGLLGSTMEAAAGAMLTEGGAMAFLTAAAEALGIGVGALIGIIAAIVVVIVAVIAIFVLLYIKWAPFHRIVDEIGNAIWKILIAAFHALIDAVRWAFHHWQILLFLFFGPVGLLVDFVVNHWQTIENATKRVWGAIHDTIIGVWNAVVRFFRGNSDLAQAFKAIGSGIESVWNGVWNAIYTIAQTAWNAFATGVNEVMKLVGSNERLGKLGDLNQKATQKRPTTRSGKPLTQPAAAGGRFDAVPGGMLHIVEAGAPEYVISTDPKYRQRSIGLIIDALRELGIYVPGFQHGGRAAAPPPTPSTSRIHALPGTNLGGLSPALRFLGAWVSEHGGLLTSAYRPWETGSYHATGQAIDIAAPGYNSPWIWSQLHARDRGFAELFGPTFMPGGGGLYHFGARFSDPSLQAQHQNHIHSAFLGSIVQISQLLAGAGGGGGILDSVLGAISPAVALHWVEDHIPGFGALHGKFGQMGGMLQDVGSFAWHAVINWIKNSPEMLVKIAEHLAQNVIGGVTSLFTSGSIPAAVRKAAFQKLSGVHGLDPRSNEIRGAILAQSLFGWTGPQFLALLNLWNQESGWRWNALNPSSGAYGIPQSLPASKMASAGADWRTNPVTQIMWGLEYIKGRYGSPLGAWRHEQKYNWYDFGGQINAPIGTSVPVMAHGGEWIINRMQQLRLARIFGSWDLAKQYLFTTQGPAYGSLFTHRAGGGAGVGGGGGVNQTFIMHAVQPQTDIDWVMRQAELHMRRYA